MLNLENIEAIIFDLGGVILNLNYDLTVERFKELGGENFDKLYSQANQDKVFDAYETGTISSSEFIKYLSKFLPNVNKNQIIEAWNAMLLDLPAERLGLLEKLNEDFKLYLFSNTNDLHFNNFSSYFQKEYSSKNLLDDYFIQTYYSHKVGARKPNSEAFNLVLSEHHLNPENVLFIDDSIQHIQGASKLGIQTFHLMNSDILSIFNVNG